MERKIRDECVEKVIGYCVNELKLNDKAMRLVLGRATWTVKNKLKKSTPETSKNDELSKPKVEETSKEIEEV